MGDGQMHELLNWPTHATFHIHYLSLSSEIFLYLVNICTQSILNGRPWWCYTWLLGDLWCNCKASVAGPNALQQQTPTICEMTVALQLLWIQSNRCSILISVMFFKTLSSVRIFQVKIILCITGIFPWCPSQTLMLRVKHSGTPCQKAQG